MENERRNPNTISNFELLKSIRVLFISKMEIFLPSFLLKKVLTFIIFEVYYLGAFSF